MRPGQVERHAAMSLFAALEVATRQMSNEAPARDRASEFLDFPRLLARTCPHCQIHVILGDVTTHKPPEVERWLRRNPRFHFIRGSNFRSPQCRHRGYEPDRGLVRHPESSVDPARQLCRASASWFVERRRPGCRDRAFHPRVEHQRCTLRMVEGARQDPPQGDSQNPNNFGRGILR
jgi:hypothetical protein